MKLVLVLLVIFGTALAFQQLPNHFENVYAHRPRVYKAVARRGLVKCIKSAKRHWQIEDKSQEAYRHAIDGCKRRYETVVREQEPSRLLI
jgi:hypothetical protein